MKSIVGILALSFVAAIPLGGFLFGFITCTDCGWNVLSRAFIGFVMAVLTVFTYGFPPKNEAGVGEPFNAWPFILIVWALTAALLLWRRSNRKSPNKAPEPTTPAVTPRAP